MNINAILQWASCIHNIHNMEQELLELCHDMLCDRWVCICQSENTVYSCEKNVPNEAKICNNLSHSTLFFIVCMTSFANPYERQAINPKCWRIITNSEQLHAHIVSILHHMHWHLARHNSFNFIEISGWHGTRMQYWHIMPILSLKMKKRLAVSGTL